MILLYFSSYQDFCLISFIFGMRCSSSNRNNSLKSGWVFIIQKFPRFDSQVFDVAEPFFRGAAAPVFPVFPSLFLVGCVSQFHIRIPWRNHVIIYALHYTPLLNAIRKKRVAVDATAE